MRPLYAHPLPRQAPRARDIGHIQQGAERGRHSRRKRIPNPLLVVGAGHSQEFGSVGIQATVARCHGGIQSMTASEGVEFTRSTRSSHAGLNLLAECAHCVTSALSARLDSKTADLPMPCARDAKRYQIVARWRRRLQRAPRCAVSSLVRFRGYWVTAVTAASLSAVANFTHRTVRKGPLFAAEPRQIMVRVERP